MSESRLHDRIVGLESIPKLISVSDYHKWKLAIENYLLVNGCLAIVQGTDVEPFRKYTHEFDDGGRPLEIKRTERAGSVMPTSNEITGDKKPLTTREEDKWQEWRKRELRAQGAIMSTVDSGLLVDVRSHKTAYDMWQWLVKDMQLNTSEHRCSAGR
ncbi:hypothetical protein M231_02896 [Tremella mesenterica]|uniref:DUF4219 domain-containing protein n=1 Tax=Tremella mesenterica TaxID=5217 RepID=A0A4Q1BPK2_TREME|nr:hypothetical protein M231_02896 [Tremella mesenterica]